MRLADQPEKEPIEGLHSRINELHEMGAVWPWVPDSFFRGETVLVVQKIEGQIGGGFWPSQTPVEKVLA